MALCASILYAGFLDFLVIKRAVVVTGIPESRSSAAFQSQGMLINIEPSAQGKEAWGGKKKEYLQAGLSCVQRLVPGCHCEKLVCR